MVPKDLLMVLRTIHRTAGPLVAPTTHIHVSSCSCTRTQYLGPLLMLRPLASLTTCTLTCLTTHPYGVPRQAKHTFSSSYTGITI